MGVFKSTEFKYSWQFNGVAPYWDILEWCEKHLNRDDWSQEWETFYFKNEKSYAWFLLRWS